MSKLEFVYEIYKNNKFLTAPVDSFWLKICYFYISQMNSNLNKIFYKIVYNHIIYPCDFFAEFRQPFCYGLYEFSQSLWFPLDTFLF